MLEGLKNMWFKELQPLPESAEGSGVWPFTGNPRAWIDKSDPNYTPSIYADRPSIDVTGSGVINPVGGAAKGIASKLKGKLTKNPKTYYHGTKGKFSGSFSIGKAGSATDPGWMGKGFYFSESKARATQYAKKGKGEVVDVSLNIKNPIKGESELYDKISSKIDSRLGGTERAEAMRSKLTELGYDGVIVKDSDGFEEIMVLNADQIIQGGSVINPVDGKSLADEMGLRYLGEADGLEYFGMPVPKKSGGMSETTIATKGVNKEQLIEKINKTNEAFSGNHQISNPIEDLDTIIKEADEMIKGFKK